MHVFTPISLAFFTMMVGLAMAEVCSAHPTSGGPYYWAAMLSKPQHAAFASWVTGWFNLLGQVAVTTGIRYVRHEYLVLPKNLHLVHSFAVANFISTVATFQTDFVPTAKTTIGIYAAVLVAQGNSIHRIQHVPRHDNMYNLKVLSTLSESICSGISTIFPSGGMP